MNNIYLQHIEYLMYIVLQSYSFWNFNMVINIFLLHECTLNIAIYGDIIQRKMYCE